MELGTSLLGQKQMFLLLAFMFGAKHKSWKQKEFSQNLLEVSKLEVWSFLSFSCLMVDLLNLMID
jgi:hypothetical protein